MSCAKSSRRTNPKRDLRNNLKYIPILVFERTFSAPFETTWAAVLRVLDQKEEKKEEVRESRRR